jgi:hypothetical protein
MASELTQAMIVNGAVLVAVLESDLGPHRRIGRLRVLRPPLAACVIVPLFVARPATHGTGLLLEVLAAALGFLGGLAALALMEVYRSPRTGGAVSRSGWPYALLWVVVVGARTAFSYGSAHWFPAQLASWCGRHDVSAAAITDGLILMAVAMLLTRTVGLAHRAAKLPPAARPVPLSA